MSPTLRFSPDVIAETLGGETIVVNTVSGSYFALEGVASETWERIERSEPLEERHHQAVARALCAEGLVQGSVPDTWPPAEVTLIMRYDDMQEMLLLDPIHDVGTRGWPSIAQ